jgi:hypothetical protein
LVLLLEIAMGLLIGARLARKSSFGYTRGANPSPSF